MTSHGSLNARNPTIKRILREATELSTTPTPFFTAAPLPENIFEWHFTLSGPPSTPYEQGIYHGRIILPPTYPLRPPSFRFLTPSGRFETNREICLSISGHHEESWQPAWGIRTAIMALRGFMEEDSRGQVGGFDMSAEGRRALAAQSRAWVCRGCGGDRTNEAVMREVARECREKETETNGPMRTEGEALPRELRLGYRDELGRGRPSAPASQGATVQSSNATPSTTASLLDTPSILASLPNSDQTTSNPSRSITSQTATTHAPSGPLIDTRPTPTPTHRPVPPNQPFRPPPHAAPAPLPHGRGTATPQEAVPAWIDKAIGGVAAALVVMVVKKGLGL
ncbi:MAG: hypothetical protein M1817_003549 [Caeruleum heppii]|nr:MAG: hypothetical protein M1817_003549 [Caeruleum heppii]